MDKSKIKILLLEDINVSAKENFKKHGFENVELLKHALSEKDLIEKIKDIDILGIRAKTQVSIKVLKYAKKLKAIGCFMVGTNNVDLDECKNKSIAVFNDPFSNNRSVAELVIGNIISLFRQIPQKNKLSHEGIWDKSSNHSFEILNKNIGILGYGNIGTQVGILAEALGMNVYYYDVIERPSIGNAKSVSSLVDLLKISNVLSLHIPENKYTKDLINSENIKILKDNSFIINTARGSVVNIEALVKSLKSGHIAGAAVDVFSDEPCAKGDCFTSPFTKFDNVIITPHIGANTEEAQEKIGLVVSNKLIKVL